MHYYCGDACENSFVLFDCLDASHVDALFLKEAHRCLLQEGKDDALLLLDAKTQDDALFARILVLGADGAVAEFCGNGARVCAAYLFARYPHFKHHFLLTAAGRFALTSHGDDQYSVQLPRPGFALNEKFIADPAWLCQQHRFHFVDMLEPHLIVQEHLSDEALLTLGKELNRQSCFPHGINVNAWHVLEDGETLCKNL